MNKYTVIDLFSGAGGLSEGFMQTNLFDFLAHIEWDIPMVKTLRENLITRWGYTREEALNSVIHFDLQKHDELMNGNWSDDTKQLYSSNSDVFIKQGLNGLLKNKKVDFIIGGPPCQAYSIAGRAQDKNSMKFDYRNYLFESFVKVVDCFKPKAFIFENVPGMLSAKPGNVLVTERIYKAFEAIGYRIRSTDELKKSIFSSEDFGVPQKRNRVIIFGTKIESSNLIEKFYHQLELEKNKKVVTVRDALEKLPKLIPLEEEYKDGNRHYSHSIVITNGLENHVARYHNKRDIKIFKTWLSNNMNKLPMEDKLEFYFKQTGKKSNHNKYRSLEWDKPSPTIVAHLYKDGLMFIHPDIEQARSITIREAALLQTFPIDYKFVGSNASNYKMIGNAVPVKFASKIATALYKVFEEQNDD